MRRIILAGALAAGSLLVAGATTPAAACNDLAGGNGVVYVTDDEGGVWVYAESNGNPGLQRGGVSPIGEAGPLCGESGDNPDLLVI